LAGFLLTKEKKPKGKPVYISFSSRSSSTR